MVDNEGLYTKYFVLKLDGTDPAVAPALLAYADACGNKQLARDLAELVRVRWGFADNKER